MTLKNNSTLIIAITTVLFARILVLAQKPEIVTQSGHYGRIAQIAFSPNGKILASAGGGTIRLWEVETGRELRVFSGHNGAVYSVSFSPDGKWLASGGYDLIVRIWEVETGREVAKLST